MLLAIVIGLHVERCAGKDSRLRAGMVKTAAASQLRRRYAKSGVYSLRGGMNTGRRGNRLRGI
jgi:hypothetical protein